MLGGEVVALVRYPVKSMMGEQLAGCAVTDMGLLGDRRLALVDEETGKVVSAKNPRRWPTMFGFQAAFTAAPEPIGPLPPVRITFPDGSSITTDSTEFAATLSGVLGRAVTLATSAPTRPSLEEYWPDLPELSHQEVVTDEDMPAGTFFDLATIHVLTTATLDRLQDLCPTSRFETRRFRPNLVIRPGDDSGFVENKWVGQRISVGHDVVLTITDHCPRCVMTTLAQGDLPKDSDVLRTAARHNDVHVGVYAEVTQPGTIHVGDPVVLC